MTTLEHKRPPRAARVPYDLKVQVNGPNEPHLQEVSFVNLSVGGIALYSFVPPSVGTRLACRLECPDIGARVETQGEVVWRNPESAAGGTFGVRFCNLNESSRHSIFALLKDSSSSPAVMAPPATSKQSPFGRLRQSVKTKLSSRWSNESQPLPTELENRRLAWEAGRPLRVWLEGAEVPLRTTVAERSEDAVQVFWNLGNLEEGTRVRIESGVGEVKAAKVSALSLSYQDGLPRLGITFEVERSHDQHDNAQRRRVSSPSDGIMRRDATLPGLGFAEVTEAVDVSSAGDVAEVDASSRGSAVHPRLGRIVCEVDDEETETTLDSSSRMPLHASLELAQPKPAQPARNVQRGPRLHSSELRLPKKAARWADLSAVFSGGLSVKWKRVAHGWMSSPKTQQPIRWLFTIFAIFKGRLLDIGQWARGVAVHFAAWTRSVLVARSDWGKQKSAGARSFAQRMVSKMTRATRSAWLSRSQTKRRTTSSPLRVQTRTSVLPARTDVKRESKRALRPNRKRLFAIALAGFGVLALGMFLKSRTESTRADVRPAKPVSSRVSAQPVSASSNVPATTVTAPRLAPTPPVQVVPSPTLPSSPYAAGPIPTSAYPTLRTVQRAPAASQQSVDVESTSGTSSVSAEFGSSKVSGGRSFLLRMSKDVEGLQGSASERGFAVVILGALSLDRAGPIAAAHPFVERAIILNKGDRAELMIEFAQNHRPKYRVVSRGNSVEIIIGTRG